VRAVRGGCGPGSSCGFPGDAATLRYRTAFDLVVGGTHLTHEAWTTALYERRDGRWKIVWGQSTAIPNDLGLFIESIKPGS